ncbi:MAG: hypothetical protein GC158_13090 [Cyanobacteria bacterium RI_101]|jgi:hypothetical protein|nr:hypothetical protein [Cyanobacteria bacterium RI_101]
MQLALVLRRALFNPTLGALVVFSLSPLLGIAGAGQAQDPPAKTYQPGFWQPQARFNPKKNLTVKIVNATDFSLDYDIVSDGSSSPQTLAAGQTGVLEDVGVDSYIMVYPGAGTSSSDNSPLKIRFTATVNPGSQNIPDDNVAVITVTSANSEVSPQFLGHRTMNFQRTGAIYFY